MGLPYAALAALFPDQQQPQPSAATGWLDPRDAEAIRQAAAGSAPPNLDALLLSRAFVQQGPQQPLNTIINTDPAPPTLENGWGPGQTPASPDQDPSSVGASLSGGDTTPPSTGPKGGLRHALGQMLVGFAKGAGQPYREEEARIEWMRSQVNNLQSESAYRNAQLQLLRNPIDKPAQEGKTVETADGVWQWNPASSRYDIKIGDPRSTVGKTPEEQLFASLLQQGLSPEAAYTHIAQLKAQNQKPPSASFEELSYQEWHQTHPKGTRLQFEAAKTAATRPSDGGGSFTPTDTPVDPNSHSILAQTGLSYPAFAVLTGNASQLPRDKATRTRAMQEAQQWANKRGVDVSTMAAQYKANNDVLQKNIQRMANTKIMENEIQGTIENLQGVVNEKDLGRVNFANVAKIWAGQEVNDPLAQQYATHLYQLRNELSAYAAATQGRSGNEITLQDQREAERVIHGGISSGSLNGLSTAVANSTSKMGKVMQQSVDAARQAVWDVFGVGDRYEGGGPNNTGGASGSGSNGSDPFAQFGGKRKVQ